MPVYVDRLLDYGKRNAEGTLWCHMTADTPEELHEMAAKIGRKRCWFHRGDHYDLTPSFREKAIAAGAVDVSDSRADRERFFAWRIAWRERYGRRRAA